MVSARVAFVLGGGGVLGAVQVGMLRAALERGIRPDLVVGTSIGAVNGAIVAADVERSVERLEHAWTSRDARVLTTGMGFRPGRAHMMSTGPLVRLLEAGLTAARTFADLEIEFRCCAASIERAAEHWFTEGPLIPAVLASSALPGIFPAVEIGGEHFVDGGIVNSIPVSRAVALGAQRIYVLHVGRLDRPLEPPRWPWEVALVAFEIARRHRFLGDLAALPDGLDVHVLPTGQQDPPRFTDLSQYRYRDTSHVGDRIARAHEATAAYLDERGLGRT